MGNTNRRIAVRGLAAVLVLASCGSAASTAATVPANPLVAEPLQYRDDIAADRLQLQLTNGLDEPLPVIAIQFVWAGFSSPITPKQLTIGAGQRVDLPVQMNVADCTIAGTTVLPAPPTTDASVVLTLSDGTTRTAAVADADATLVGIHTADCERQMILQQATIEFVSLHRETIDGRPITAGVLRIERGFASDAVSLVSAGRTIPFNLQFPTALSDGPLVVLDSDQSSVELTVHFIEGRCDAHAVAEAKQPFRFVVQLDLGDGVIRPLVVEPDATLRPQMLATVAEGCAALGLDGALQPAD